jgi:hypothetical protein
MNLVICNSACFNFLAAIIFVVVVVVCNSASVIGSDGIESKLYLMR